MALAKGDDADARAAAAWAGSDFGDRAGERDRDPYVALAYAHAPDALGAAFRALAAAVYAPMLAALTQVKP